MKLLRYGPIGQERPGVLDSHGDVRDLSDLIPDITPEWLSPAKLLALSAIRPEHLPLVSKDARIGAPVAGVRQFIAIGLNYRKHAEESGLAVPTEPVVFTKAIPSIAGPNDDLTLPFDSTQTDWEVELGVVIGSKAQAIHQDHALEYVAGYCLANDVSERDWQINRNGQWGKGKSFDGFGPLGPWLVTADEIKDPQSLDLELSVNGTLRQRSSCGDMIFSVSAIVTYLSQFMTLLPGDVIITGTPAGVGLGMKPPQFLKKNDVITLSGGILGTQKQHVR